MSGKPAVAYKILTQSQMVELETTGAFTGAPVDLDDGYIHLSTAAQVTETVDRHFAGQIDIHVVAVDLEPLGNAVRWEPSRGGQLFPHLYAALTMNCVLAYGPLERDMDGQVMLPIAG